VCKYKMQLSLKRCKQYVFVLFNFNACTDLMFPVASSSVVRKRQRVLHFNSYVTLLIIEFQELMMTVVSALGVVSYFVFHCYVSSSTL
jgi:hypothetical protein